MESTPEVAPVLPASLDVQPSLVFNWVSHSWAPPVPTVWPPMEYEELGPYDEGPSPTSRGTLPDYLIVLPEVPECSLLTLVGSPDKGDRSIPSPHFSPDTFLSLVFDKEPSTPSPTCSPNVFLHWVQSHLFPGYFYCSKEQFSLATGEFSLFTGGFLLFNGETRVDCQKMVQGPK